MTPSPACQSRRSRSRRRKYRCPLERMCRARWRAPGHPRQPPRDRDCTSAPVAAIGRARDHGPAGCAGHFWLGPDPSPDPPRSLDRQPYAPCHRQRSTSHKSAVADRSRRPRSPFGRGWATRASSPRGCRRSPPGERAEKRRSVRCSSLTLFLPWCFFPALAK